MSQRSPEFWSNFDQNVQMLDLVQRQLQNHGTILDVSKPFVRTMRDGELLAIEFIPHLARFCQKIVDWYDPPQLSMLDLEQLGAVFKVIKSIRHAVEGSKPAIIHQGIWGQNPLEYYQFYVSDLNTQFSRFQETIQADLRRRKALSTSSEVLSTENVQTSRIKPQVNLSSSTVGVGADCKPRPRFFVELDSETDESDDTDNPFRVARKKTTRARHEEQKSHVMEEPGQSTTKAGQERSSLNIEPEVEPEPEASAALLEKRRRSVDVAHELKPDILEESGRSMTGASEELFLPQLRREVDPEPEASAALLETRRRSVDVAHETKPDILEKSGRSMTGASDELFPPQLGREVEPISEPSAAVVEQRKRALVDAHELSSNVLGDIWVTHKILRSCNKLEIKQKVKEQSFRLSEIGRLAYPRSLLQTSLSTTSEEEEDEKDTLPNELVIIIDIQLESGQTLSDPSRYLKLMINRKELLVHKVHHDQSTIRLIIPVQPEYLKVGFNKIAVNISKESPSQMTTKMNLSVEEVTMLSEKEAFEKAIRMTCPAHRVNFLTNSSSSMSLVDPISGRVTLCPVRGVHCQHFQCFDLSNFINLHRFKSTWTCPFESCKASCSPFELEFDHYVFQNIAQLSASERNESY